MLGPVRDGGYIIANTAPGCWGPMITPAIRGGHEVTQPVAVEGAEIGDSIAIRLLSIDGTSQVTSSGVDSVQGAFCIGDPFVAAKCQNCGKLWPGTHIEGIGKDGKALEGTETYSAEPLAFDLGNPQMIPGLRRGILGQKVGSTATAVIPPAEMFGEAGNAQLGVSGTDSVVMVVDVKGTMLKEAKGKEAKPKKGLPTVKYSTDKPATFTMPKGKAPTETQVETLVAGDGEKVAKGDTVYVSYTGALWKNGKVFDSSKQEGRRPFPVTLGQGQVIKGWDEGLVGTKVGDRVLLVVPPKDGYGATGSQDGSITKDDTIVFVVDVLGAV